MSRPQNVPKYIEVPNKTDKGIQGCRECVFYFSFFNIPCILDSCPLKPKLHWEVNPKYKNIIRR